MEVLLEYTAWRTPNNVRQLGTQTQGQFDANQRKTHLRVFNNTNNTITNNTKNNKSIIGGERIISEEKAKEKKKI